MGADRRNKENRKSTYPRNVGEWREAIGKALNLTTEEAKASFQSSKFPFDDLVDWIYQEFGSDKGYSPDFIPALIRNSEGLIAWAYGEGPEPCWPGQDEKCADHC